MTLVCCINGAQARQDSDLAPTHPYPTELWSALAEFGNQPSRGFGPAMLPVTPPYLLSTMVVATTNGRPQRGALQVIGLTQVDFTAQSRRY